MIFCYTQVLFDMQFFVSSRSGLHVLRSQGVRGRKEKLGTLLLYSLKNKETVQENHKQQTGHDVIQKNQGCFLKKAKTQVTIKTYIISPVFSPWCDRMMPWHSCGRTLTMVLNAIQHSPGQWLNNCQSKYDATYRLGNILNFYRPTRVNTLF